MKFIINISSTEYIPLLFSDLIEDISLCSIRASNKSIMVPFLRILFGVCTPKIT